MNYYRHGNAKETARDLDFWVNRRLFWWLRKRHRLPDHSSTATTLDNLAILYSNQETIPKRGLAAGSGDAPTR